MRGRGATQDECARVAVRGETLRVRGSSVPTQYSGEVDLIYALGDRGTGELVFAVPGTLLRIADVRRAIWPEQVGVVGTNLMAWTYPARRRNQPTSEAPVACLCFFRSDPWGTLHLHDLTGVLVEITADGPPSLALPAAEVQSRVLTPFN